MLINVQYFDRQPAAEGTLVIVCCLLQLLTYFPDVGEFQTERDHVRISTMLDSHATHALVVTVEVN